MKFAFNQKLKELRIKKNVTQEQLAGHLRISPQAVSKWERGEGYPDIMLLPRIALYFGVSIDELLGIDEERIREQIEKWKAESQLLKEQGEIKKDAELWERAYGEYPSELDVMSAYMVALSALAIRNPKQHRSEAEKAVGLGKEIMERSTDVQERNHTIQLLAFLSDLMGDSDEAVKYAQMTSNFWTCREVVLGSVLNGDEKIKHIQSFMMQLTDELAQEAWVLSWENYSIEEQIRIYHYILGLFTSLFTDGDYGFYAVRMSTYSSELAKCYAKISDRENCLRYLNDAAKFARMSDEFDCRAAVRHTSLLLNRVDTSCVVSKNHTDNECTNLLKNLNQACFDFIRENSEFITLQKNLEPHT